jgi:hypothetical protein
MHPVLANTDTLSAILYMLPKSTLAVLGRTCKTFSNAALEKLWENMTSIVPLCKCLPEDVCSSDENNKLVR